MSVKIESLTKSFGEQRAIDRISFSVEKGEVVGFLGPNGSGKSTTMRCICGILSADEGKVSVNGLEVQQNQLAVKRIIGYLPENNPLPYEMYVKEYLRHVDGYYNNRTGRDQRIENIIELTGLGIEQHKLIGQLSKGYKQRVGLAQAMIHDPEVLILDEPTTGLDPNQLVEIRSLVSGIAKNKTVILSTHILQEVEAICDRVVVLNRGQLVADGTATDITEKSQKKGQLVFVEFRDEVSLELLTNIESVEKIQAIEKNAFLIEAKGDKDLRELIFNFSVKNKLVILGLQKKEDKLEAAFRKLTQHN